MKKIEVVRSNASTIFNITFDYCDFLEDITLKGEIEKNIMEGGGVFRSFG